MSCLSVDVSPIIPKISLSTDKLTGIEVEIFNIYDDVNLNVNLQNEQLELIVEDSLFQNHLKLTCGIVCTVESMSYLRVSPKELQWITPDYAIIYTVESDTDWVIETS